MAVIEKYAKDNNYTLILDVSNQNTPVLYASSGIDITSDIISLYDKNPGPAPSSGATPTTAAPGSTAPRPGAARPAAPGAARPSGAVGK
jgi:outer membrane protein